MARNALVTGAHGHTGTFLVKLLLKNGFKIMATDLKPLDRDKLIRKEKIFRGDLKFEHIDHPDLNFIPADLLDKESLRMLWHSGRQYDVVFHPASLYDYFAPLHILLKINVQGTRNLLDVICEKQARRLPRFIHWSTCGVYGEPEYEYRKDEHGKKCQVEADETALYDPPNWYSTSKMFQELVVYDFYINKKVPMTIIRPMPISGPAQLYGAFNLYYLIYKMGTMMVPYFTSKKYEYAMPCVHVEDLVRAALFCFEHDETIGEAYNVGCDNCTQADFLDYVNTISGVESMNVPIFGSLIKLSEKLIDFYVDGQMKKARKWGVRPLVDGPMMEYIGHNYYFSNEKLKKLGFEYKYPTPFDVARDSIRWYLDHGWFD